MGPGDPLQKNLLRVYLEPAWVFPGLVVLVDRCWSAGKLQRDDLPELTKTVEAWLSNNQFFDPDSSLAVRRLFAGTVAITSHLMFKAQPGLESN